MENFKNKLLLHLTLVLILTSLTKCMDKSRPPANFTAVLEYNLSDTSGEIKIGDTMNIDLLIPNPIITTSGESVSYNSIKFIQSGFYSFLIGDSATCTQGCYRLLSKKGFDYNCDGSDFNTQTRSLHVSFIPNNIGWTTLDCIENGSRLTIVNGKDEINIDLKYKFNSKNRINEMTTQYPCIKYDSERKVAQKIGYCAIKVIK